MTEPQHERYGIRKAVDFPTRDKSLPTRDLLVVPHRGKKLTASYPTFRPNTFDKNVAEMQRAYTHSVELPQITFREPTTSQSVSIANYRFGSDSEVDAKRDIFDPKWLQAGRIVRTKQGVIVNPILDAQGNVVLNQGDLEAIKTNARKIEVGNGHIYLGDKDFGFAEYTTFQLGIQDSDTFAQGGLARIIEHTENQAIHLKAISSKQNYPRGVDVWGFEIAKEPIERVLSLYSGWDLDSDRLFVDGVDWNVNGGYAFGVR